LIKFLICGCFYDSDQISMRDLRKTQFLQLRSIKLFKIAYFIEILFFVFLKYFLQTSFFSTTFLTKQNLKELSLKKIN